MKPNHLLRHVSGAALLAVAAAGAAQAPTGTSAAPVTAQAVTTETAMGEPNMAVIVAPAGGAQAPRIVGTAELGGLEIYAADGRRLGTVGAGEASGIDVRHDAGLGGRARDVVATTDSTDNSLRLFELTGSGLTEIGARSVPLGFAVENVCLHRSGRDGGLYAFVLGDGGEVEQWLLYASADGRIDARQVRRLSLPSTVSYCVVDDRTGSLYVAQEAVGLWRFDANPEADAAPAIVDAVGIGHLGGEIGGLALYEGGQGARWLLAADLGAGRLLVFDRDRDHRLTGSVTLQTAQGAVEEPAGLHVRGAVGSSPGLLVAANENARNYALFNFGDIAAAAGIATGTPQPFAEPQAPEFPVIRPRIESVAVPSSGDAADDPAIWADPSNPSASLFIGTDKRAGLHLYDMQGRVLQFLPDGKMNNVDLREGFRLGGRETILVTASNRTTLGVSIYALDPATRRLVDVADGVQASGLSDPYGLCMYRSRRSGRFYVFVSDPDGLVRQWELVATAEGRVRLRHRRDLRFSSQTEGCVADDERGILFVGEEDIGLWRVNAEPRGAERRAPVDAVQSNPRIRDDVEGLGIYDLGGGRGYVVASSQGNDSYAVYRREAPHDYLGSFTVVADGGRGIDGISETDGLEVTSRNLGPGLEHGAMIAQDGRNVLPSENQNFKVVSWSDIAAALNLELRR